MWRWQNWIMPPTVVREYAGSSPVRHPNFRRQQCQKRLVLTIGSLSQEMAW